MKPIHWILGAILLLLVALAAIWYNASTYRPRITSVKYGAYEFPRDTARYRRDRLAEGPYKTVAVLKWRDTTVTSSDTARSSYK